MARAVALLLLVVAGCGPGGGTYCQSGPKYGTKCYAQPDVTDPPGQRKEPEDPPPKGETRQQ